MRAHSLFVAAMIAGVTIVLVGGCGGSGGPQSSGEMGALSVLVLFPPDGSSAVDTKVIPTGTNSVVVSVLAPETRADLAPDTVIARPEGSNEARKTIEHLRAGPALIEARAKTNADGTGPTLAQAVREVQVPDGGTVQVGLNLFGVAATFELLPTTVDVLTTKTVQVTATAYDAIGNIFVGAEVNWDSSNTTAATVSDSGLVTGVTPGASTVTATETREGLSASCAVTVTMREPTNVAMEPTSAFVRRGQAVQLTARAYDRDGDEIVGEPFAWESSATAVATINASGLATAVSEGDATITVTTSNGKMATALVDVNLYVVKLAWEGDADLDLHVFGPAYAHASVHSPEIAAGKLMTSAAIPAAREYFSGRARLLGAYYVGVNYYGGTGAVEAQVTVEGIGPEPIVRTYSLTQANQNAGYPVRGNTASWFRPLDVFISGDDISSFGPDTTVPLYDTDPNP